MDIPISYFQGETIISAREVCLIVGFCALNSFDRNQLKNSLSDFKPYLELEPGMQRLMEVSLVDRYEDRHEEFVNVLNEMKEIVESDFHLSRVVRFGGRGGWSMIHFGS